jgi:hypothetical protein
VKVVSANTMSAIERSTGVPKTIRNPSPVSRSRCRRWSGPAAAGRGCTQNAMIAAEMTNETASRAMPSRALIPVATKAPTT